MSIGGIYETYNKPLETYDYEKLKDHPLIDATTIGLKGSPTNIFKSFTPPPEGRWHDAGRQRQGDLREAGRHPGRQAHHLRKGNKRLCLTSTVLISLLSSDVWVFCEQREGKLMPTDFELISKGRDRPTSWA